MPTAAPALAPLGAFTNGETRLTMPRTPRTLELCFASVGAVGTPFLTTYPNPFGRRTDWKIGTVASDGLPINDGQRNVPVRFRSESSTSPEKWWPPQSRGTYGPTPAGAIGWYLDTSHSGLGVRDVRFRPDADPLPLTAFTPVPDNAAKVTRENDVLRLTGGPGFLRSEKQYADFVLQCEVKLHGSDSNSGLFFRTVEPTEAAPSNGYEVQLQNTLGPGGRTDPDDYGDGFGTGAIFRRQPARYVNADDGEWFHLTLVCVGNRMATWVNGLQVTDFTDDREPDPNPRKGRRDEPGYLVLQAHDPGTDVSFRNVRVQELASD